MKRIICAGAVAALALGGCAPESLNPHTMKSPEQSVETPSELGEANEESPTPTPVATKTPVLRPEPDAADPAVVEIVRIGGEAGAQTVGLDAERDGRIFIEGSCVGQGMVAYKVQVAPEGGAGDEDGSWFASEIGCDTLYLRRDGGGTVKAGEQIVLSVTPETGVTEGWVALRIEGLEEETDESVSPSPSPTKDS